MRQTEAFKPIPLRGPAHQLDWPRFLVRLFCDPQALGIYRAIRRFAQEKRGILIDVGCGNSPYAHLFASCRYVRVDIAESDARFSCSPDSKLVFNPDGTIPCPDNSADLVICTEVLEHVLDHALLIAEMERVLKAGGEIFVSVPWSARCHYMPFDYWRFTPAALEQMFGKFENVRIEPRGTDLVALSNKVSAAIMRTLTWRARPVGLIAFALLSPIFGLAVAFGTVMLLLNLGSTDDPLGYCLTARKRSG